MLYKVSKKRNTLPKSCALNNYISLVRVCGCDKKNNESLEKNFLSFCQITEVCMYSKKSQ